MLFQINEKLICNIYFNLFELLYLFVDFEDYCLSIKKQNIFIYFTILL